MTKYKYTHDTERWLRSNAALYERKGNLQMARNMEMCADELKRLREEVAALKESSKPVVAWWRKERMVAEPPYQIEHLVLGTDGPECVGVDELDALAALVGEEVK